MTGLIILDGVGERQSEKFNAVKQANTPFLDGLKKQYSHTLLKASEEAVGLTKGQMGNSEVGHMTIGAGEVVRQDLTVINDAISNGEFYKNQTIINHILNAKKSGKPIHVFGLLSDGGVHSHINHLFALLETCKQQNFNDVYIHVITDGRDTGVMSGINFIKLLNEKINKLGVGKIATIYGGGGHIKASGAPMDNSLKREVLKLILNNKNLFSN